MFIGIIMLNVFERKKNVKSFMVSLPLKLVFKSVILVKTNNRDNRMTVYKPSVI